MATITLKYQKNQSHEIRVEDLKIGKVNNKWTVKEEASTASFFMEEYKEAIEMVNAIIALCDSKKEDGKRNGSTKKESESINNRILFVGQRGTGKTSAMTSFSKGLDDAEIDNHKALFFKSLPMIDPSNFDNNTNILLTVITMMFSEAKELMKENGNNEDIISTRESLLKQFDEAFKSLKAITGSDRPMFTLEGLNEKSRALQMRTGMHNLVKRYIEFYNKTRMTNIRYLVLLIDDIDMTVSHVPEMLEQLRKYLDLDNLLILMSANLGQLYNEMREHYSKAFKETLNDRNQALSIDVEDLANKYLLKLFPTSRRIRVEHLVSQLIGTNLKIIELVKEGNSTVEKNLIEPGGLQNVVLSLIWQKTRLLFVPKDAETMLHPIIPTNLRELMQFLDMLVSLDEVSYADDKLFKNTKAYGYCEENIRKFKKYILHNWIPSHLSVEEELVFEHIPTDITEINKHLINSINVIGNQHRRELMSREVGLDVIERNAADVNIDRDIYTMVSLNDPKFVKANKISDIFNQPSNYSYGDLLLMIDKYETYFESEDNRKFTDAIKIYYSILLFETMFFESRGVKYKKPTDNSSLDDLLIPIQKLIGGTVYYPNYFEIITDKNFNQKGPSYDAKRAFYHKLPVKEKTVGDKYPFFAVLYYGDIRPDRYDTNHIYDTTFDNNADIEGIKYVTFDILSILSNMLNPWHTFNRADGEVFHLELWEDKIKGWSSNCVITKDGNNEHVDANSIYIPNSILPFYSVDIMLNYLKHQYKATDIAIEYPDEITFNTKYNMLFEIDQESLRSCIREQYDRLLSETEVLIINLDQTEKDSIINDLIIPKGCKLGKNRRRVETLIKQIKNLKLFISEKDPINDFWEITKEEMLRYVVDDKNKELMISNIDILKEIHKCYSNASFGCVEAGFNGEAMVESFRNHINAVLLSRYKGSKKELNTLIKELQKYSTISEIYKHLVDVLWVNTNNEIIIHGKIQTKIRDNESVGNYYLKLWCETAKMLEIIARPEENKNMNKDIPEAEWKLFFESTEIIDGKVRVKEEKMNEMRLKLGNSDAIISYLNLFFEAKKVFIDNN